MTLINITKKVSYRGNTWKVICDCGMESEKRVSDFHKLQTCSYVCPLHKTCRVHPVGSRKEYTAWKDMLRRCLDTNNPAYANYGGRGITVYEGWVNSFHLFYGYMGAAPAKHSIDRVNNDKGYEPGNVRWATQKTQSNNKRNTVSITANGQTKTLSEWADQLGVSYDKLYYRYQHGWAHEDIVNKVSSKGIKAPYGKTLYVPIA